MLEGTPDFAGIAVGKVRPLHHQHIGHTLHGIDPGLGAPGAARAISAGREHRGDPGVGLAQDAGAEAPSVVHSQVAEGSVLEKPGRQVAGLGCGEEFHGVPAQIAPAITGPAAQQHPAKTGVVGRGGKEPAIPLRRPAAGAVALAGRHRFQQAGILVFGIGGDQPGALGIGRIEGGVFHPQRIKKPLLEKGIKGQAAHYFHDAGRRVDAALGVSPLGAGFILHRSRQPERDEIRQGLRLLRRRAARLAEAGGMRQDLRDREIGRFA